MKKTFIMALACGLFAANANAQVEKWYGGEQGSFAISVNAEPVINFAGNILNGTQDNALDTEDFAKTIAAKYFVSDNFALTAQLSLDNSKDTEFGYENYEEEDEITSKIAEASQDLEIRFGFQNYFRPGKRLQPFVGANILYGRTNTIAKGEYFEFENDEIEQFETSYKVTAPSNTIGLTACLGAELFLGKNISISTSLDLGIKSTTHKVASQFDTDNDDVDEDEIEELNFSTKTGKSFSFATGQMRGNLALSFYF